MFKLFFPVQGNARLYTVKLQALLYLPRFTGIHLFKTNEAHSTTGAFVYTVMCEQQYDNTIKFISVNCFRSFVCICKQMLILRACLGMEVGNSV
jgi:hypothetical protein